MDRLKAKRDRFERFLILYEAPGDEERYSLEFEVLEVTGETVDNGKVTGELWFGETTDVTVPDFFLQGHIKWDGCSNWSFEEETMVHFCGFKHATSLGRLMGRMYQITLVELETFDPECAEMGDVVDGQYKKVLTITHETKPNAPDIRS